MLRGVGVGLRARHYRSFLEERPTVDWLEVHTENYLQPGGLDRHVLLTLREYYDFSFHGVGLGLGSARGFSESHLMRVVALVRELEPALVSDHLCWGATAQRNLHDLLPVALSEEMLSLFCERVDRLQNLLKRPILLENVSTYLRHTDDAMSEIAFLNTLARRTGCGILLDVNNLYVNQCNQGESALEALHEVDPDAVAEIHLAGHLWSEGVVVDHHGDVVAAPVWELYRLALARLGAVPTLIEWDTDVPELPVLLDEARLAREILVQQPERPFTPGLCQSLHLNADAPRSAQLQARFSEGLLEYATPEGLRAPHDQVEQRFARYRGNQTVGWEKTLASAFPVLKRLMGDEFFAGVARAYGRSVPTTDPDLNQFGELFSHFLETFEPAHPWPYFPAMAELEWALHRAYYAADADPLTLPQLLAIDAERLEGMRFTLHPACCLLSAEQAVGLLWQAHQTDQEVEFPDLHHPSRVLIHRENFFPRVQLLNASTFAFLLSLERGQPFGAAVEQALAAVEAAGETFDLGALLGFCIQLGLLVPRTTN